MTLEREREAGPTHTDPPLVNVRHFARLAAGRHDEPAVHELVRARSRDRGVSAIWEGRGDARASSRRRARSTRARAGPRREGLPLHVRLHGRRPRDRCAADAVSATQGIATVAGVEVSTDHFIGGERVASRERLRRSSRRSTGQLLAEVARGGGAEADAGRARRAAPPSRAGRRSGRPAAPRYLHRLADLIDANVERLAAVECLDMAMLLRSLRARVIARGARNFRNYADLAVAYEERTGHSNGTWNRVMRMPAGPAAVITPWNAPFMLSTWKIAPALAAGCTVVLKPAEWSPLSCSLLADLAAEAGLPAGRASTSSRGSARRSARRSSRTRCAPDLVHRLARDRPPDRRGRRPQPGPVHRPSSAARGRCSCSTTPTSRRRPPRRPASTTTPARSAWPGRGCWSRRPSREAVPRALSPLRRRARARRPARGGDHRLAADPPRAPRARRRASSSAPARTATDRPRRPGRARRPLYEPTLVEPRSNDAEIVQREVFGPVLTFQTLRRRRGGGRARELDPLRPLGDRLHGLAERADAGRPCAARRDGLGQHLPRPRPDGAVRRDRASPASAARAATTRSTSTPT